MQFQVYDHLKGSRPDEAQKAYDGGVTLLRQAHFEARRLISGVRPPILDESGILAAMRAPRQRAELSGWAADQFSQQRHVPAAGAGGGNSIYRIIQEALANASKHSKSERVQITLRNGASGFAWNPRLGRRVRSQDLRRNRFGLAGVRERARLLGGKCRIESKPNQGTRIVVELPLAERETDDWHDS